jgi:hypothetical protein
MSSSRFPCVYKYSGYKHSGKGKPWRAEKSYKNKVHHLGLFQTEEEAHAAVVVFCTERGIPLVTLRQLDNHQKLDLDDNVVEKECLVPKCGWHPAEDFPKNKGGLGPRCKTCTRDYDRQRKTGWNGDEYNFAYNQQKEKRFICDTWHETLCADHCHETGERGALLCTHCNLVEGHSRSAISNGNITIQEYHKKMTDYQDWRDSLGANNARE